MPTYTPVDPSLAAFNPAQITHGIMDVYQTMGTAAQLKAFNQHALEVANTEGLRTKLLKAQADQEAIKADAAQAQQDATNRAIIAKAKHEADLLDVQTPNDVKAEQGRGATLDASNATLLSNANLALSNATENARLNPFLQGIHSFDVANARSAAPYQSIASDLAARALVPKAKLDLIRQQQDLAQGGTGEERLVDAKVLSEAQKGGLDAAQAQQALAAAAELRDRNATKINLAQLRSQSRQDNFKAQEVIRHNFDSALKDYQDAQNQPIMTTDGTTSGSIRASQLESQFQNSPGTVHQWLIDNNIMKPTDNAIPDYIQNTLKNLAALKAEKEKHKAYLNTISENIMRAHVQDNSLDSTDSTPSAPKEGDTQTPPQYPGTVWTLTNGKWIRTK